MGQSTKRKEVELRKEVLEHVLFLKTLGRDYEKSAEISSEKPQSTKRKTPEDHAMETGLCTCTEYCKKCRKRDAIRAWYSRKQEALNKDSKDFELEEPKKSKISLKAYKERKQEALNKDSKDFELGEPEKKKTKISEDDDDLYSWTCQIELY